MEPAVGSVVDRRYALKRLVASTETSLLFDAVQIHLDRRVAVRLLTDAADPKERAALMREARLLHRARHPGVLELVDLAQTESGEPFLVTGPLLGRPLDGVLSVRGSLPVDEAIAVAIAIGEALAHAHTLDIAHAGLGAGSVAIVHAPRGAARASVRQDGTTASAILLDFGISPGPASALAGALAAMGYAAPERLAGAPPDPTADVHALGALLHEMLTGELPGHRSLDEVVPRVPDAVAEVVHRALASRPGRFEDAGALVAALRRAITSDPPPTSIPPPARRAHVRAGYVTPIRVRCSNGQALDGRSDDISEGGLLLLVDGELPVGEEVLVRFALPISGRIVSEPARTCWSRATRGAHAVGVQLIAPSEKVREDVRAYVRFLGATD